MLTVARSAGWWWPFTGVVILTERPVALHRDERGRLHNTTGAALLYPDGWGVWAVHGVRVPAWIIETPEKITPALIDQESNAEIRRIMVEKYGTSRYLIDSGTKPVHTDEFGTLYRRSQPGDEDLVMVHVVNSTQESDGSYHEFFLRVHPDLCPMKDGKVVGHPQKMTAINAVASTFGLTGEAYRQSLLAQT